jgi:hypothetical protein
MQGDFFVVYMAGEDIAHAFTQLAASQSEFDRWLKQLLQETTGADLNTPPLRPISEILTDVTARPDQTPHAAWWRVSTTRPGSP